MSNFSTQRLVNKYPSSTKIRSDPSSFGARFYSSISDPMETFQSDLNYLLDEKHLLKASLGQSFVYTLELEKEDFINSSFNSSFSENISYPTQVLGTTEDLDVLVLERDEFLEDLLYGPPTRLQLLDSFDYGYEFIWDSESPETINNGFPPERIFIEASNSKNFYFKSPSREPGFGGYSGVWIKGLDENENEIEEFVRFRDDNIFQTKNIFKKVTSRPKIDGFDGRVKLSIGNTKFPYLYNKFKPGINQRKEGPLYVARLGEESSVIEMYTLNFLRGVEYKNGFNEILDNKEEICLQHLVDSSGDFFEIEDFCLSPDNGFLYVLDSENMRILVYELSIPVFKKNKLSESDMETRVVLLPLNRYIRLGSEEKVFTFHQSLRNPITSVSIKRISPSGSVAWLKSDRTWSASEQFIPGNDSKISAEDSWADFEFVTNYNELGQWDYIITTRELGVDYTSATSVIVPYLEPLSEIEIPIEGATSFFFSKSSLIKITDNINIYSLKELRDTYLADIENQSLYFRQGYNSVEVIL